jgi:hypothetical protein
MSGQVGLHFGKVLIPFYSSVICSAMDSSISLLPWILPFYSSVICSAMDSISLLSWILPWISAMGLFIQDWRVGCMVLVFRQNAWCLFSDALFGAR